MRPPQCKYWCFTLQVDDANAEVKHNLIGNDDNVHVNYAIWQLELGSHFHYQGYIEFKTKKTMLGLKELMLGGAHWEIRRGTDVQARDYCAKSDSQVEGPWEFGTFVAAEPGKRTDLLEIKQRIDDGASDLDIAADHFSNWCRYRNSFSVYRRMIAVPRKWKTQVICLWGVTGNGKSRWAVNNTVNPYHAYNGKWWDDYDGSQDVILDDFTGWIEFNILLRMMDEYPCKVEMKGGAINWAPRRMVITSNLPPWKWYEFYDPHNPDKKGVRGDRDAMDRRIEFTFSVADALPNAHAISETDYRQHIPNIYPTPPPWETGTQIVVPPPVIPLYVEASSLRPTNNNNNSELQDTSSNNNHRPDCDCLSCYSRKKARGEAVPEDEPDVLAPTYFTELLEASSQAAIAVAESNWQDQFEDTEQEDAFMEHNLVSLDDSSDDRSSDMTTQNSQGESTNSLTEYKKTMGGFIVEDSSDGEAVTLQEASKLVRHFKRKNPFINDEAGVDS